MKKRVNHLCGPRYLNISTVRAGMATENTLTRSGMPTRSLNASLCARGPRLVEDGFSPDLLSYRKRQGFRKMISQMSRVSQSSEVNFSLVDILSGV